jgi:uncharacterized protein (TIGR03067 family)
MIAFIRWTCLFPLLIPTSVAPADDDSECARALKTELARLQGKWVVIEAVDNGRTVPDDKLVREEWTIKGTRLRVTNGAMESTLVFRVDVRTDPKLFDAAASEKDLAQTAKTIEGVYEVKGDRLRFCYNLNGTDAAKGNRPVALESKAGANSILLTLNRQAE